jgi:hypothetical protein
MQQGFFRSLFDVSFTSFVTTRVIKVLYVLSLVILAIAYLVIAIACFTAGGGDSLTLTGDGSLQTESSGSTTLGLLWLFVIGPLLLFFYTLACRVMFELVVVLFRLYENSRDQLAVMRAASPTPGGSSISTGDDEPPAAPVG